MQITLWILVVVGLVAMFFGYFFGLIEGRGQGYKRRRKDEAEAKEEGPDLEAAAAADTTPTAAMPADADPGILRIKEDGGQMRLELDGEAVQSEGLSPAQRKRLIGIITGLRPWIEAPAQAVPAPTPSPAPASEAVPAAPPPAVPVMRAAAPARPAQAAPAAQEAPAGANTMVGQIDEILQRNILDTSLAERGLRLVNEPGGGVAVLIDNRRFSSIGEVTDPEVQAALRSAVALWEKKYTPGA